MDPAGQNIRGRALLTFDRSRWAAAIGCAIALTFALQSLPFSADELLARSLELQEIQGGASSHVYAALQGHPTELCAEFGARQPPVLQAIGAALVDIKKETAFEPLRMARLAGVYNRDIRALFLSPPADPACWKEDGNSAYFQAGFPIDSPFIWIIHRLRISTIHATFVLMAGSWLGLICLFLVARRLTQSAVCGVLTVWLYHAVWTLWPMSGGSYFFVFNAFVPMYAGQLLCSPRPILAAWRRVTQWAAEAAVIIVVALHSLLQIFVYPFTHRLNVTAILVTVAACGLLNRDRRVILRAAALAVALYVVMQPYYRDSRRLHAQLTSLNLAAGEGFTTTMVAMGMFERPTYLGLPNGDYAFTWIQSMDPYLLYTAPNLVVHQSLDHAGRTLVSETIRQHPLTLIEAIWKRVLIQTAYHRRLNPLWYYERDRAATLRNAAFLTAVTLFGIVCVGSLAYPATWALLWPPAALIGWHLFGVNTLTTMVHLHVNYVFSGLFMLLALTPAMVLSLWTHRADPVAAPLRALVVRARAMTRPARWVTAAAVVGLLAFGAVYFVRESRKELVAFNLWQAIHYGADAGPIGQAAWRSPAQLAANIRTLQALGHEPRGAVEMYATWVFWVYNYQNGLYKRGPATNDAALQAQYRSEAESYIHAFYLQALQKAPDNAHFGSYAVMLNDPAWATIFRRALAAAPDDHHAGYMAYHLIREAAPLADLKDLIHVYETETARLLSDTATSRPGYEGRPRIAGADVIQEPEGESVHLSRGQSVTLPAIPLQGAPKLRVGVFLGIREGSIHVTALPDAAHASAPLRCTPVDISSQTIEHYWRVDCDRLEDVDAVHLSVTAVEDATVVVRDYYPMFTTVRVPQ